MSNSLLWVDDEIELLHPHIIFLQKKGYQVTTANNGNDAVELCQKHTYDLILLDEMMPGLSGLETLQRIKIVQPATPVVMVTKSEEEDIMNQAIGQHIADYLIKPVNPMQILLTLKKNIHKREIVSQVAQTVYQQNFMNISMQIDSARTLQDWFDVYKRLTIQELQLSTADTGMMDMLLSQKEEANNAFARFVSKNYISWINKTTSLQKEDDIPIMSNNLMAKKVFPLLDNGEKVFLIVIDNLRYDQWRTLAQQIGDSFEIEENLYTSILPTATQYARNAIFSGLMPDQIAKMFPDLWVDEDEEEGKNLNEAPLIQTIIDRYRRKDTFSYHKINDSQAAEQFLSQYKNLQQYDLNVLVVNFIDMLSHARTESKMVRELANNETAYRSITQSWFQHSPLALLFKKLAKSNYTIILTTDHGSIRTTKPIKIIGDKNTNTNLRYKLGKNLAYNPKDLFTIKNPKEAKLPSPNISTTYVFALGNTFLAYPNNFNYYVSYFKNTFQHGGISMEEML
ncbi:MAG: PglZ domain-containing protein, partial [Bacteroidaceae bacterium]|nr:PglZ domain-containing protein [Bacteroidaceae bacterium]